MIPASLNTMLMGGAAFPEIANLEGLWKFNEGTGTFTEDFSASGQDGTLTNSGLWAGGKVGSGIESDGTNYVSLTTGVNLFGITGNVWSWFAWVYGDNTNLIEIIHLNALASGSTAGRNVGLRAVHTSSGLFMSVKSNVTTGFGGGSNGLWLASTLKLEATPQWHLLAGMRNGNDAKMWNYSAAGQLSATLTSIGTTNYDFTTDLPNDKNSLHSHWLSNNTTPAPSNSGTKLDIVGHATSVLTDDIVEQLWNNGNGVE